MTVDVCLAACPSSMVTWPPKTCGFFLLPPFSGDISPDELIKKQNAFSTKVFLLGDKEIQKVYTSTFQGDYLAVSQRCDFKCQSWSKLR